MSDEPAIPELRFLKGLVTVLTATMILGVLAIVALLVTRLPAAPVPLPETIELPDGAVVTAFTRGPDWWAVATEDSILVYDLGGTLAQTIAIERP